MIELFTSADLVRTVAARWRDAYGRYFPDDNRLHDGLDRREILRRLEALPAGATAADVDAIIGNDTWARPWCHECGRRVDAVVEVGDADGDYCLCRECVAGALAMFPPAG